MQDNNLPSLFNNRSTEGLSSLEVSLLSSNRAPFAGVDEAGRGPLAGPVVAAAVLWDYSIGFSEIKDSKKLYRKCSC